MINRNQRPARFVVLALMAGAAACGGEPARMKKDCFARQLAASCVLLAQRIDHGADRDLAGARAARETACRLKDPIGCGQLAEMLENGTGGPVMAAQAIEARRNACDGENLEACEKLGDELSVGLGVSRSASLARASYSKACAGHRPLACARLHDLGEETLVSAADKPPARRRTHLSFALQVVGEDANPDKESRCREEIAHLGGRLDKHSTIKATLTLAPQNSLMIRSATRGLLLSESLPGSMVSDLCQEVMLRASRAAAGESHPVL